MPGPRSALILSSTLRGTMLVAIGVGAAGLVLWATPHGIAITKDSNTYAWMASVLREGTPLRVTHFPYGYPGLVALTSDEFYSAARLVSAVTFGAIVALAGWITLRLSNSLVWAAWVALLIALSRSTFQIGMTAISEPLGMAITMTGLALVIWKPVAGAAVLGLAPLVRYALVPFPAVSALAGLLWGPGSIRARLRRAVILGAVGLTPTGLWVGRNLLLKGEVTPYAGLEWHPVSLHHLRMATITMRRWLLPTYGAPEPVHWILAALVIGASATVVWRALRQPRFEIRLLALSVVGYLAFLLLSISVVADESPLDARMYFPAVIPLAILAGWALSGLRSRMVIGIAACFVVGHAVVTLRELSVLRRAQVVIAPAVKPDVR